MDIDNVVLNEAVTNDMQSQLGLSSKFQISISHSTHVNDHRRNLSQHQRTKSQQIPQAALSA
jgi:hypothetical protein